MTNTKHCSIIINVVRNTKNKILRNCVTVARQTLTLFVGVRIPIPQPSKVYKKDVTEESLILSGFFAYFGNVFQAVFQRCQKGFFPQNRIRTFTKHIFTIFREQFFKNCSLFYCQDLDRFSFIVKTSRSFFILQRR